MPSLLGTKINELRRARGLTLEQLAQATESSKSYMWEIENKDVARPSAEKLDKIASALGVTANFLIDASQTQPRCRRYRVFPEVPEGGSTCEE